MAKKDENNTGLTMGVDSNGNPVAVQIDSVTGALLVNLVSPSTGGTKPARQNAKHDENNVPTATGSLSTSGSPYPILLDGDGYLKIDLA